MNGETVLDNKNPRSESLGGLLSMVTPTGFEPVNPP